MYRIQLHVGYRYMTLIEVSAHHRLSSWIWLSCIIILNVV